MGTSFMMGSISGYLSKPSGSAPWPGLIVIQEWWGLDHQTQSIADRFAGIGYLAFAPDLYHGELAKLGDGRKASALVQKYSPPLLVTSKWFLMRSRSARSVPEKLAAWVFASADACHLPLESVVLWMPSALSMVAVCSSFLTSSGASRVLYLGFLVIKTFPSRLAPSSNSISCLAGLVSIMRSLSTPVPDMPFSVTVIRTFISLKRHGMPGHVYD